MLFRSRELSARVRAALRRGESAGSAPGKLVAIGDVQVDLSGHRIFRGAEILPVKPRAFLLLAFFIENRGRVFTREQLLERVWGTDFPGETRTVDVHVHALREAIEPDPADPKILQTVRGTGYVLRADAP